jgi:hypothetical protein
MACSADDAQVPASALRVDTGRVRLSLAVGSDTLTSVAMKIYAGTTASGTPVIARDIDVSSPNATISAFAGALGVGSYVVTFDATTSSSQATCHGQDAFTVTAGATTTKTVVIACGTVTVAPARGSELVNGQITNATDCPYLQNVVVTPLRGDGTISASTEVSDPAASVQWQDGSTIISTTAQASLDCSVASGTHHLTVSVTKANTSCLESQTVDVICGQVVTFDCVASTCVVGETYCSIQNPNHANPNGRQTGGCAALPASCRETPTCACLCPSLGGVCDFVNCSCNDDVAGEVSVVCDAI